MYEEHPVFKKPDNTNVRIWRFIDFTKYVSMLESKALFFCRADLFPDIFEGTYPKLTTEAVKQQKDLPDQGKNTVIKALELFEKFHVKGYYLNCWHMNDYESDAMWKLYTNNNLGVAIQSTFELLTKSISDEKTIYVGKVNYIDYNKQVFPINNTMYPYVHKRISYSHEQELRALTNYSPKDSYQNPLLFDKNPKGFNIKVDLDVLIEKIYISPNAPDWFKELVKSVSSKYNLGKPIESSSLDERPLFR